MTAQTTTSFQIENMSCGHCVAHVEKAFSAVPGVASVSVDLASETAKVSFDGTVNTQTLSDALNEAGYPATAIDQ
jgi:P-type Cu+ transporter